MADSAALVFIVDDEPSVREALRRLLSSAGFAVETYGSALEFLDRALPDAPSCLVLDVNLPGLSGLDLQKRMAEINLRIPIVFMTGRGDIPTSVRAMKAGALDFLSKPFTDQEVLGAVEQALQHDRAVREQQADLGELQFRLRSLTGRERQVMERVVSGLLNKQIAAELGTSEIMIKVHRGRVMKKMQARSLADLVRMSATLGIRPAGGR